MDAKILVAAAGVAIVGIWLFKKKNDEENDNRRQNRETQDLDDPNTLIAVKLKRCLEWEKGTFGQWGGPVVKDKFDSPEGQAELYNICLQITDWAGVQKKFSALCNNESTILQAFQEMLKIKDVYNNALDLCKAKKVVTTTSTTATLEQEGTGEPYTMNANANVILGAYTGSYDGKYIFINGFESDGSFFSPQLVRTTGRVPQTSAKLV